MAALPINGATQPAAPTPTAAHAGASRVPDASAAAAAAITTHECVSLVDHLDQMIRDKKPLAEIEAFLHGATDLRAQYAAIHTMRAQAGATGVSEEDAITYFNLQYATFDLPALIALFEAFHCLPTDIKYLDIDMAFVTKDFITCWTSFLA